MAGPLHHRQIRAEDIPEAWQRDRLNIRPEVFERMLCLACGTRGRPQSTIILPVCTGPAGDGWLLKSRSQDQ